MPLMFFSTMKLICLFAFFLTLLSRSEQAPSNGNKNVEVYFVADHKALSKYLQETSSVADAKLRMEGDIDYFITQLNVHFESLGNLNVVISKRGLTILDEDLFPAPNNQVVPETGLNSFKTWLTSQHSYEHLNYDAALLFTGYDLARSSSNTGTAGLAGVGVVCHKGTAIVEYDGTYNTVSVAAHEIGHNLGADHDPEGSGYVMSPSTNAQSKERWEFSDKSYSEISRYLHSVSTSGHSCLGDSSTDSVIPNTRVPDQLAYPDGVCTRKYGPQSYFCRMTTSAPKGDDMCNQFFCSVGYTNGTCLGATSSDGLVCGTGKACVKGSCITDPESNTQDLDENCLYGDQKKIAHDDSLLSCSEWLATGVSGCNDEFTRTKCCATCEQKATGDPNCPYGNQDPLKFSNQEELTTCEEYLKGVSCTMPSVKSLCCGTCAQRATGNPDCPYGDEMLNFNTGRQSCSAYLTEKGNTVCEQDYVKRKCCDSCGKAATGNPACPYGDAAYVNVNGGKMTCNEIVTHYGHSQCSQDWMKNSCCATCGADGATDGATGGSADGSAGSTGGNTDNTVSGGDEACKDANMRINSGGQTYDCASYIETKGGAKCNDPGIKNSCCASCAKEATGNPDLFTFSTFETFLKLIECPYGDMQGIIFDGNPPQTCTEIMDTNGNSLCYRDDFQNKFCCATCSQRETGDSNCMFGDKSADCKKFTPQQICNNPTNAELCCDLCKSYSRERRSLTVDDRGKSVETVFIPNDIVNIPEPLDIGITLDDASDHTINADWTEE